MAQIRIGQSDNGGQIRAALSDAIVVALPENPTTGSRWQIELASPSIRLIDDQFQISNTPTVGEAGTRIFTFAAEHIDKAELRLRNKQAWEDNAATDQQFKCSIDIGSSNSA